MARKLLVSVLFILSLLWLGQAGVSAQDSSQDKGITISPVRFEFDIKPGETKTNTIKLINSTSTDKTIYLYMRNFISDGVSGTPLFITEQLPFTASLKDWITLSSSEILVKKVEPDNSNITQLTFTVTVPANAEPGGHYAGIIATLVKPGETIDAGEGKIAFKDERAAIILINVEGEVSRSLSVDKFYATDNFTREKPMQRVFEWMPVGFLTELRNTGNSHTVPVGNIIIYNGDSKIAELDFNPGEGNVLRESSRQFFNTWSGALLELVPVLDEKGNQVVDDKGNITSRFSFNFQNMRLPIGRFNAKLAAGYDDNNDKKTFISEFEFWVIPWKLLLVIFLLLAAFFYFKFVRKGKKKQHPQQ